MFPPFGLHKVSTHLIGTSGSTLLDPFQVGFLLLPLSRSILRRDPEDVVILSDCARAIPRDSQLVGFIPRQTYGLSISVFRCRFLPQVLGQRRRRRAFQGSPCHWRSKGRDMSRRGNLVGSRRDICFVKCAGWASAADSNWFCDLACLENEL